jgi:hypothetical protein
MKNHEVVLQNEIIIQVGKIICNVEDLEKGASSSSNSKGRKAGKT